MKKNTILKKLEMYEEKITNLIQDFQDFLDSVDDFELSEKASEFSESVLDFIHENDTCNLNDIRDFIENDYEQE